MSRREFPISDHLKESLNGKKTIGTMPQLISNQLIRNQQVSVQTKDIKFNDKEKGYKRY